MVSHKYTCLLLTLFLCNEGFAAAKCLKPKRITGSYGLQMEGRTVKTNQPYVSVGVARFDKGQFTLELTQSEAGVTSHRSVEGNVSGTDCTIRLEGSGDASGFSLVGQTAGQGQPIYVTEIRTKDAIVASGSMQTVGLKSCKTAKLKGSFVYLTQGYQRTTPPDSDWLPVGKIGRSRFDGQGCTAYVENSQTGSERSVVSSSPLSYAVNPDCSFTITGAGQPGIYGVILEGGKQLAYMVQDDGTVRGGRFKRTAGVPRLPGCGRSK